MKFVVFDTEDTSKELYEEYKQTGKKNKRWGFKKRLTQIAAQTSDGRTYYSKGNIAEFRLWLRQTKIKFVYAHNLQYDLGGLFADELDVLLPTLIGSRLIRCEWGDIIFRDSMNMFPGQSVKKMGEAIGLKKLEFSSTGLEYVFRDVEIVKRCLGRMLDLANDYGVEKLTGTIGGLAVKIWKSLGGENWFDDSEFVRDSYFGGRVEVFKEKGIDVSYTDVTSLYPYCLTKIYPTESIPQKDLDCLGVAYVRIKIPEMEIAPLPFRNKDGRVIYPIGRLEGMWTTLEIQNAIKYGCEVEKVFSVVGSKTGQDYYGSYVNHFAEKKRTSENKSDREFFKYLLNTLYGQLATKGEITRTINAPNNCMYQCFGSKALVDSRVPLPDHTNYLHGSFVTSYARIELNNWLHKIDPKNLLYCDTDSMIFEGDIPFQTNDELGGMKLEGTAKTAHIIGPKCYMFGEKFKAKGVPRDLAEKYVKTGHAEYAQPYKLKDAINWFDRGNEKKLSIWREVRKSRKTIYDRKAKIGEYYMPIWVDEINQIGHI